MTQPFPIPRDIRQTAILNGDGSSVTFGPFAFKIFDLDDVVVWVQAPPDPQFTRSTVVVEKVQGLPLDFFTVTFPAAVPVTTSFVVDSSRISERSTGVVKGTKLDATALEKELSKQASVQQELRRDIDRTHKAPFGDEPGTFDASALASAADNADRAEAARLAAEAASIAVNFRVAANRSGVKSISTLVSDLVFLRESGREGLFKWTEGDFSAQIAADTLEGVYIKANGVAASLGAWVRQDVPSCPAFWFGAAGDGVSDDTAALAAMGSLMSGQTVDLQGRTFRVAAVPTNARYVNGFFSIGANVYDAEDAASIIASVTDTGGLDTPYGGGFFGTPTVSGRTTRKLNAVIASQNSRSSYRPRNVVLAGIYSWITSLVGALVATRQSYATQPQSFIAGTEECWIDTGSRNSVLGSINSTGEGTSTLTGAARSSRSSGWESAVVGSNASVAGAGSGARFQVNVNASGVVTTIDVLNGGSGYIDPTVEITDRVSIGSGATATVVVINGVITAANVLTGGSGYSRDPNAVNCALFSRRSMVVAGSNNSTARGNQSFIGGSVNSDTSGSQSAVLASNRATASGVNSAAIASGVTAGGTGTTDSVASGDSSMVAASSTAIASGASSSVISSIISTASALRAMVLAGRRVLNNDTESVALGTSPTGSASSANTKIKLWGGNGNIDIAGVLTQNKVFTDIAKMFENVTPGEEIPVGSLVSLDGRKVRLARAGDTFFSVHTRTYVQLLGDTGFTWAGRYMHDDYGKMLTEEILEPDWVQEIPDPSWPSFVINPAHPVIEELMDEFGNPALDEAGNPIRYVVSDQMIENPVPAPMVPNPTPQPLITVQVENPDYDPAIAQTPRSQRPWDWTPMLLQGEAFMHVTADVAPGDYIRPVSPGIGGKAPGPTSFLCMEIMSPFDGTKGFAIALGLRV